MLELHWTLAWTLAALGLAWLVVSTTCALALGKLIRRSDEALAEPPEVERIPVRAAAVLRLTDAVVTEYEPRASEPEDQDTRASGTRLKPVYADAQDLPAPSKHRAS